VLDRWLSRGLWTPAWLLVVHATEAADEGKNQAQEDGVLRLGEKEDRDQRRAGDQHDRGGEAT
jgi:hypothetical protein